MKIISDYRQDTKSPKPIPGSYEWWYFDAISDDGKTSFVIIFYEGNPFSRRYIEAIKEKHTAEHFPAISLSVYNEGKPVYYGFEEVTKKEAYFSSTWPEGKIGSSEFRLEENENELTYHIEINHSMPNGDTLEATLRFRSSDTESLSGDGVGMPDGAHSWNLVQPLAEVTGLINIRGYKEFSSKFSGSGYHDHNAGEEPMKDSFDEWYWGRFHLNEQTLIYYLMNRNGNWSNHAYLLGNNGKVKSITGEFEGDNGTLNIFGLHTCRKLIFQSEELSFTVQQNTAVDNGPFYQRFLSSVIAHKGKDILIGRGISEYIKPSRIYSKIFWPLVNMRIRYPDQIHWVQKKPGLYRWTW